MANQEALQAAYEAGLKAARAEKTLDFGAALERFQEIQDKFDDVFREYQSVSEAIADTFRTPAFDISSTMDSNLRDKLDTPRILVSRGYDELNNALDDFIKVMTQVVNAQGG